jgi:hypothetical protein
MYLQCSTSRHWARCRLYQRVVLQKTIARKLKAQAGPESQTTDKSPFPWDWDPHSRQTWEGAQSCGLRSCADTSNINTPFTSQGERERNYNRVSYVRLHLKLDDYLRLPLGVFSAGLSICIHRGLVGMRRGMHQWAENVCPCIWDRQVHIPVYKQICQNRLGI